MANLTVEREVKLYKEILERFTRLKDLVPENSPKMLDTNMICDLMNGLQENHLEGMINIQNIIIEYARQVMKNNISPNNANNNANSDKIAIGRLFKSKLDNKLNASIECN